MTFKFFILFPHFPTDVFRIFSGIPDISNLYFYSLSGLLGLCFIIYSPLYHFLLHCYFIFLFTCIVFCSSISFLLLALSLWCHSVFSFLDVGVQIIETSLFKCIYIMLQFSPTAQLQLNYTIFHFFNYYFQSVQSIFKISLHTLLYS